MAHSTTQCGLTAKSVLARPEAEAISHDEEGNCFPSPMQEHLLDAGTARECRMLGLRAPLRFAQNDRSPDAQPNCKRTSADGY